MKNKRRFKILTLSMIMAVLCLACNRRGDNENELPIISETQPVIEQPSNSDELLYAEASTEILTESQTEGVSESMTEEATDIYVDIKPATDAQMALANLQLAIDTYIPGIVCWGDSLTVGAGSNVGYPHVLAEFINNNILYGTGCEIPVVMMGVGGETSYTIAARAGGLPFVLTSDVTIPAECVNVQIPIKTIDGNAAEPILQGDEGMEYVEINGVKGTLEFLPDVTGESGGKFIYYFKRSEPGDMINVQSGTPLLTRGYLEYKDYLPIIFMGENGGYSDPQDLIRQQMSIVNTGKNKVRYLMIGITSGTAADRSQLEQAMMAQYGDQYLNARELLSRDGMSAMQIEATVFDEMMMEEGKVPGRLLTDSVHLNEAGYRFLGAVVYNRLYDLGYFNEVSEAAEIYRQYIQ